MSLIRCTRLLGYKNGNPLNLFKHSTVYYSDDKKSDDDGNQNDKKDELKKESNKKSTKQTKSASKPISAENQTRLNDLLKKLSSRSTLNIVKEVQGSKPLGYKKLRQSQKLDAKDSKPKSITAAATAVSKELGDEKVKDDLLGPYGDDEKRADFLDDVISTMKAPAKRKDKQPKPPVTGAFTNENTPRENPFRRRKPLFSKEEVQRALAGPTEVVGDVFDGKPIGIFEKIDELKDQEDSLKTWSKLEKHELRLRMSMAPRNYFEKMAYWTEEGKIWQFPIDNEQGLDEELRTSFTEHIFLDEYIESWCPKKGAVHNFMELVCIGLSKNPYLSVQQKHEHLDWYRDYFEQKRDILMRVLERNESNKQTTQVGDGSSN